MMLSLLILLFIASRSAFAQAVPDDSYRHVPIVDVSSRDQALNFGVVYAAQWAGYFATQRAVIQEYGSWKNWRKNIINPHFDNDSFDFNLYQHTAVGQYYYLFYRSRGYGKQSAFEWSALSSVAFEFTIESLTERPSYQDLYQTPVFGLIVGMGFEKLSLYFHSLETWPTTILGYLFNPFTAVPDSQYKFGFYPTLTNKTVGLGLALELPL